MYTAMILSVGASHKYVRTMEVRTNDGGSKFESAKKYKLGKKTITSVFTSN